MYKYIIKHGSEVAYSSDWVYNTFNEAHEAALIHLDSWEVVHELYGTIEVLSKEDE